MCHHPGPRQSCLVRACHQISLVPRPHKRSCHPISIMFVISQRSGEICFPLDLHKIVISTEGVAVVEKPAGKRELDHKPRSKSRWNPCSPLISAVAFKQVLRLRCASLRMTDFYLFKWSKCY